MKTKIEIINETIKEREESIKKLNEGKPKLLEDLEKNLVIAQINERYLQRRISVEGKEKFQNELGQVQQQIENIKDRIYFVENDKERKSIQKYIDFLKEVLADEETKKTSK